MNCHPVPGAFLHELSAVERAQPRPLTTGVTMGPGAAGVQCVTGPPVAVPCDAGRTRIAELLSLAVGPVVPPAAEDPDTYGDAPGPQQLWAELLDDLGAHLPGPSHADPLLRLMAGHREDVVAGTEVTDGAHDLRYEVALDSREMPAVVPVGIARVFPSDPARRS